MACDAVNVEAAGSIPLGHPVQLRMVNYGLSRGIMQRNPGVFVKGRVSHPDHRTIHLRGWHRVVMNTETQAPAMRHVAFLD